MGAPLVSATRLQELHRLQSEISRMQRRRAESAVLPIDDALSELLPERGLRVGGVYTVAPSLSLLGALLAPPSQKGLWCAMIGMPTAGLEALSQLGVNLDRLLLVPEPGAHWLTVSSALSEVVPLVAVNPTTRVRDGDVSRLTARLRDRACTLLTTSPWPQSEATLRLENPEWRGVHHGWGLLEERAVTVVAESRRRGRPQRVRVLLPGPAGTLAPEPLPLAAPIPLRAVG